MHKVYNRVNWENYPSTATPVNEQNLNAMDLAINEIDNRVVSLDATKLGKTEATGFLQEMEEKVQTAQTHATNSASSAKESSNSATKSQSYAVGGTGTRENEDIDNARYYYNQLKQFSQGINGVIPMGTITFAELPALEVGDGAFMYNISDAFTSDDRFNDGGGISYGAGNNVFWTAEGKWDVTASSSVSGVKGSAEEEYRTGYVNITPGDLGLGEVLGNMLKAETLTTTSQFNITADTQADFFIALGQFIVSKGIKLNETMHLRGVWANHFYVTVFCTYMPGNVLEMLYFDNGGNVWIVNYNITQSIINNYYKLASTNMLGNYLPLTGGALSNNLYGPGFFTRLNGLNYGYFRAYIEGTEETNGLTLLTVGNNTASGNPGNAYGRMRLYGTNTGFTDIAPINNSSADTYLGLPSKSGTVALTSDITDLNTLTENEQNAITHFIENVFSVMSTTNNISHAFFTKDSISYAWHGMYQQSNYASFILHGYDIRALHLQLNNGVWTYNAMDNK